MEIVRVSPATYESPLDKVVDPRLTTTERLVLETALPAMMKVPTVNEVEQDNLSG